MALTVVGAGTHASLLSLRHGGEVAAAICERAGPDIPGPKIRNIA